jgi:Bacteriophage replication protein O
MPNFQNQALATQARATWRTLKKATTASDQSHFQQAQEKLVGTAGYCAIPNILLDRLRGVLKRNEYDVFMYIVRRTLGFQKLSDAISMSQFQNGIIRHDGSRLDYGCGVKSADTVSRALKELERLGFISRHHHTAANGANTSNVFTLHPDTILETLKHLDEPCAGEELKEEAENSLCLCASVVKEDTPILEEGVADFRGNMNQVVKKQNQKHGNMGEISALKPPNQPPPDDTHLLTGMGFDQANAKRLVKIAQTNARPPDYIAGIIAYSRKNGTTNPAGLARWLIEHGKSRPSTKPKEITSSKFKALNLDRFIPTDKPVTPISSSTDYQEVWREVCRAINLRTPQPELAGYLANFSLAGVEPGEAKAIVWLKPAQAWQKRLFSGATITLLEMTLRQKCGQPCEVRFM